jgi:formylglycine-generating enzyme required for sulfatase activity
LSANSPAPVATAPLKGEATTARPPRQIQITTRVERVPVGATWIAMVELPGGILSMGSLDGDIDERPVHGVTLSPFRIGRLEVTQGQWRAVMGDSPLAVGDCDDCPVEGVSWDDTQRFITRLNQQTGHSFRLPSEAEWEYACRAGGSEPYCGDADVAQVAWYVGNSGGRVQPAGRLAPNGFGLHDMSGNLYEWVADCWHGSYTDAPRDGAPWLQGECQRRVLRGGAWYYSAAYARATYRNANTPQSRFLIYGFRLAQDE